MQVLEIFLWSVMGLVGLASLWIAFAFFRFLREMVQVLEGRVQEEKALLERIRKRNRATRDPWDE